MTVGATGDRWFVSPFVFLVVCAVILATQTGCDVTAGSRADNRIAGASPTVTIIPSGDILKIDDQIVRDILIPDPARGPLYALTDEALYVRGGAGWEPTGTPNDGRTLMVDPSRPTRLYRGGHPPCRSTSNPSDIMLEVSKDSGATWLPLPQGRNIRPLAVDPIYPDIIYGTWCWLAISTTAGHTWMKLDLMPNYPLTAIAISGKQIVVLGTSSYGWGRLRAVDISDPANPLLGDVLLQATGLTSLAVDGTRIIVGGISGIHISNDGGETWTLHRAGLEAVTRLEEERSPRTTTNATPEQIGVFTVRIDPTGKRLFAGTAHGLYVSQDDGATWARYTEVPLDALVTDIEFDLTGADLYITTTAGVIAVPAP